MAITAYFLDQKWEYREVLLGFKPLSGTHSGTNLGEVVVQILQQYEIINQVLAVTTDNALNITTLVAAVNDTIQALKLNTDSTIIQVPFIAHVIQLSLNDLLGKIKANPKNDSVELEWKEDHVQALHAQQQKQDIANTLNKVSSLIYYCMITIYLYSVFKFCRFTVLLFISMQVQNAAKPFITFNLMSPSLCLSRMYEHDGTQHILCFDGLRDSKQLLTPFARSMTSLTLHLVLKSGNKWTIYYLSYSPFSNIQLLFLRLKTQVFT
jgi:hypothetical protein